MKKIFPSSVYNPITLVGAAISTVSFGLILFLIVLEAFSSEQKPYMGIIAFVVLPAILIFGLLLIAFGIVREHYRERLGKSREFRFPIIDLNNKRYRNAVVFFTVGTVVLLLFTTFGSFKAYEYTDSDEFCGTMCHKVMKPEYTAYQYSPHARVGCVKCHIGSGADWFVRAKISGSYQVYSVLFNKYPRPIPTPIENLRPARETCEQCHWPQAFYSEKEDVKTYYLSDEKNSKMQLTLLMKIGGGNPESGVTSGIHWHMNISNQITYLTLDRERMIIPWVKAKSLLTGKEVVYKSTDVSIPEDKLKNGEYRVMDCIDCHNRPAHNYHPAANSVNNLMAVNRIDPTLPYIKSITVQALESQYSNDTEAMNGIKQSIEEFYQNNYPKVWTSKKDTIEKAIVEVKQIYSRNYFPEMKVSWRNFPVNIGHMYSPGCFRCHDGKHVSEDGKVISRDCKICHTILAQKFDDNKAEVSLSGVDYRHPVDIDKSWKEMECSDCHTEQK